MKNRFSNFKDSNIKDIEITKYNIVVQNLYGYILLYMTDLFKYSLANKVISENTFVFGISSKFARELTND